MLRENHAVQVAAGASWIRLMDPKELNARQSPSMEKVVVEGFHYFIEWKDMQLTFAVFCYHFK